MARTRRPEVDYKPHLGGGTGRTVPTHKPRYTHEDLDALVERVGAGPPVDEVIWSEPSPAPAAGEKWSPPRDVSVVNLRLSLTVAGTGNTTLDIYINGVVVETVTLGTGVTKLVFTALGGRELASDADEVQPVITAVGTGALGLALQLRYQ